MTYLLDSDWLIDHLAGNKVARRAATMRAGLRLQGRAVRSRSLDLLIAATALAYNLTFVTRNEADYKDISGLKLY
jgi:predicted nucleic acid-binding protein